MARSNRKATRRLVSGCLDQIKKKGREKKGETRATVLYQYKQSPWSGMGEVLPSRP